MRLFEPIKVNSLKLKYRVVLPHRLTSLYLMNSGDARGVPMSLSRAVAS